MRHKLLLPAAILVCSALASSAKADTYQLNFFGSGVSASLVLTYGTSTDSTYPDALEITGVSGTFSDANAGILNATVSGPVGINHATPEPGNTLAPNDFSRFAVANGLPPQSNGFVTYDNLLWFGGAPATAFDYQATGGIFDIYGLLFDIPGYTVDIYSNGTFVPGGPFDYGVVVANADNAKDVIDGGVNVAPEPSSFALMGTGLLGVGGMVRRRLLRRA